VRSFSVVPFDSKFRYLFLPDNSSSQHWTKLALPIVQKETKSSILTNWKRKWRDQLYML
jgi:hypothetical protein